MIYWSKAEVANVLVSTFPGEINTEENSKTATENSYDQILAISEGKKSPNFCFLME